MSTLRRVKTLFTLCVRACVCARACICVCMFHSTNMEFK